MTQDQLAEFLSKKYELICFESLNNYNQDSSSIYQLFTKYWQERYEPTQRLVLVAGSQPSKQLLQHIQRAADIVDISRCFIMICGSVNIDASLGFDFLSVKVNADPLLPDSLTDLTNFCPLPFFHLAVMPQGHVQACCFHSESIGNASESKLDALFQHQYMQDLRSQFAQGHRPKSCQTCWTLEDNGIKSLRQWHLKFYEKRFFSEGWLQQQKIRSLDLRPSNICNFRCRICNPTQSSLWLSDELRHAADPLIKIQLKNLSTKNQWFDDDPEFFSDVEHHLADLTQIDFYGGEPFLLKQLPKLLTAAVSAGQAPGIRLHFNTNGSVWPGSVVALLTKFKEVDIEISVDNIGRRFEIERGGVWAEVESNIQKFQNLGNPFRVSVSPTINIQNIFYLPEIIDWVLDRALPMRLNYLDLPKYLCIDNLTPAAKDLVVHRLESYDHPEVQTLVQRIKTSPGSDGLEFVKRMRELDQQRGENFYQSHKAIAEAMGYVL